MYGKYTAKKDAKKCDIFAKYSPKNQKIENWPQNLVARNCRKPEKS